MLTAYFTLKTSAYYIEINFKCLAGGGGFGVILCAFSISSILRFNYTLVYSSRFDKFGGLC